MTRKFDLVMFKKLLSNIFTWTPRGKLTTADHTVACKQSTNNFAFIDILILLKMPNGKKMRQLRQLFTLAHCDAIKPLERLD